MPFQNFPLDRDLYYPFNQAFARNLHNLLHYFVNRHLNNLFNDSLYGHLHNLFNDLLNRNFNNSFPNFFDEHLFFLNDDAFNRHFHDLFDNHGDKLLNRPLNRNRLHDLHVVVHKRDINFDLFISSHVHGIRNRHGPLYDPLHVVGAPLFNLNLNNVRLVHGVHLLNYCLNGHFEALIDAFFADFLCSYSSPTHLLLRNSTL
mmetsp:Transcript_20428/g.35225  ORF Transcript_20428/g.35225 Transcript_20428/m.35225 type:complete len:202 (+) Transcript_20428:1262-1867(+)